MFRRVLLASAAALSLALIVPFTAQGQSVYVMGGASFPTSDFGDAFDTGWMVAGGITLPLGPGGFWFGVEGSYGQNGTAVDGIDVNPTGAMAILGFDLPVPVLDPYVFGGAGLLSTKANVGDLSNTETEFGYQLGAGLSLGSGPISPFIELRYESSTDIEFFAAMAGLSFGL
jgi:opacity protein-like surface antigen